MATNNISDNMPNSYPSNLYISINYFSYKPFQEYIFFKTNKSYFKYRWMLQLTMYFNFISHSFHHVSILHFWFVDLNKKLIPISHNLLSGLDKFNICVHWFSGTWNCSARTFVHAELCVHKTVTVGANILSLKVTSSTKQ